jgi:hypothetical protein
MNLVCPNCQKKLSVADQNAGQVMNCPLCSQPFSVPALPDPALAAAGSALPSSAPIQAGSESPDRVRTVPPLPQQNSKETAPPPPIGYEQTMTIWISPRVVRWIAPVALLLVLILMFFPWTGVFPGGIAVYTQNAFQMIWGGFSVDPVGDRVLSMKEPIERAIRANWLMVFYPLLILAALLFAAAPLLLARIAYSVPRPLQRIWPWRAVLVLIATLLTFLILLSFLVNGSGFENAVTAVADKSSGTAVPAASIEEQIQRGLARDRVNLSRTFWLHAAVFFHVVALAGIGLELWLERRRARPLPRVELQW